MMENTVYSGGYAPEHETIEFFWQVLKGFSKEDLMQFVKFVTSCPRPPLLGFKELSPKLCIQASGDDQTRLRRFFPLIVEIHEIATASTCVNLLKLPMYSSKAALKE